MEQIEVFHGTVYAIEAWRLPTGGERSSRGPAAICLTPDRQVAKGYCNAADGGTEELARLIEEVHQAGIDRVLDAGKPEQPLTAIYREKKARMQAVEAEWRAGRSTRTERVYRSTVSPRNALRINAGGRKFWNLTGAASRDQDIWTVAKRAKEAGHDCLIVENVIDNGSVGLDVVATTIMVFDPAILSAPELVEDEQLTFQQVLARTDARIAALGDA